MDQNNNEEDPPNVPLDAAYLLQIIAHLHAPPTLIIPANEDQHAIQLLLQADLEETDEESEEESEDESDDEPLSKRQKRDEPMENYIQLSTKEQLYFSKEDGKNIILPITVEPNRIIRCILSVLPISIEDRLLYLSKFRKETIITDDHNHVLFTDLRQQLGVAYLREYKLRWIFRRLLNRWRIRYMDKRFKKEVDPITLCEPIKEVFVYDWSVKKKFVFDAKALSQAMETNLLYHEGGFALPKYPRNPWTNLSFTYIQMLSIFYQLQSYGELGWAFQTLRQYNFNKRIWQMYHHSTITVTGIKNSIRLLDTADARDLLEDFILSKMDDLRITITNRITHAYRQGMLHLPNHWYLERCKHLAILHYEAHHFNRNKSGEINPMCKELFKKQYLFIRDLIEKRIISE